MCMFDEQMWKIESYLHCKDLGPNLVQMIINLSTNSKTFESYYFIETLMKRELVLFTSIALSVVYKHRP